MAVSTNMTGIATARVAGCRVLTCETKITTKGIKKGHFYKTTIPVHVGMNTVEVTSPVISDTA